MTNSDTGDVDRSPGNEADEVKAGIEIAIDDAVISRCETAAEESADCGAAASVDLLIGDAIDGEIGAFARKVAGPERLVGLGGEGRIVAALGKGAELDAN